MKVSQKILLLLTSIDLLMTLSWAIWGFTPNLNKVMPFIFLILSCGSLMATIYDINNSKNPDDTSPSSQDKKHI